MVWPLECPPLLATRARSDLHFVCDGHGVFVCVSGYCQDR